MNLILKPFVNDLSLQSTIIHYIGFECGDIVGIASNIKIDFQRYTSLKFIECNSLYVLCFTTMYINKFLNEKPDILVMVKQDTHNIETWMKVCNKVINH